jgi:hypothetical protein
MPAFTEEAEPPSPVSSVAPMVWTTTTVEAREAELRVNLLELDSTGEATLRVGAAVAEAEGVRVPAAVVGVPVVAGVLVAASSLVSSGAASEEVAEEDAEELGAAETAWEDEEDAGGAAGGGAERQG